MPLGLNVKILNNFYGDHIHIYFSQKFLDVIDFHHFHKRKGTDDLNSITEIRYELHINFKMGTIDINRQSSFTKTTADC